MLINYRIVLILFLSLEILNSCKGFRENIVPTKNIASISVTSKETQSRFVIRKKRTIDKIISAINSSQPKSIKFVAKNKLQIKYKDTIINVLILGNLVKINGRSYKTKIDMNSFIKSY